MTPSLSVQERIDAACVAFEPAWQAHRDDRSQPRPVLDDRLGDADDSAELLHVERAYPQALGEAPTEEEHQARYPDDGGAVRQAFAATGPTEPHVTAALSPGTRVRYFG